MRRYIQERIAEPIYLIIRPQCGCVVGWVVMDHTVAAHKRIVAERRKGNHVIESDLIAPPRIRPCPHKTTGTQPALPGWEPLTNRRKHR